QRRNGRARHADDIGRFEAAGDGGADAAEPFDRARGAQRLAVAGKDAGGVDAETGERLRQGGEHVPEATRLGIGEGLRGKHADAHRRTGAAYSSASRRKRAASSGGIGFTWNPLPRSAPAGDRSLGVISKCQWYQGLSASVNGALCSRNSNGGSPSARSSLRSTARSVRARSRSSAVLPCSKAGAWRRGRIHVSKGKRAAKGANATRCSLSTTTRLRSSASWCTMSQKRQRSR